MTKRRFLPEDFFRLKTVADPNLSPDGRRIAWVQLEVDRESDRAASSIWVAPVDGSAPPRPFTDGPSDSSPRWSPDGRWLLYVASPEGAPHLAHLRLAPLEGGTPTRLGELGGPVSQPAWSSDSTRVAVVVNLGRPDPAKQTPAERNAPRLVRGLAPRLDGVGWYEGRKHIFVVEVATGAATQLTRGEFDHADPSWSPDGSLIAFSSNRDKRRDDQQFRAEVWTMKSSGGRPVSVAKGISRTAFPMFSPDGTRIAFAGQDRVDSWDCDAHVFTAPVDGSGPPEMVAPGLDRGVLVFPGLPAPFQWLGNSEIAVLLADHGGVALHVANLSTSVTRRVIGGDRQIDGFSALRSRSLLAFTSSWPDRPSELWLGSLKGDEPRQFTRLNDELLETVDLAPVTRGVITRPDGTDVEYFALIPAQGARRGEKPTARRLPLHLDIHGGPHGMWPSGRFLGLHQSLAGAGYVVLLPNPRGSTGYGQGFTEACTGDWGGEDCEDILACCDDLVDKGIVDEGRMFLSGGSYGGFMTSWIVGHSRRFRAAAAMAAVIDQASLMLTTEIPDFCRFNFGGTPWEQADEFTKRSPLTYLPDVSTPVLVVHWEGDLRVPIAQGEELYAGLRLLGKEAEFVRYPGGFHIYRTPSQAVDWMHQIIDWDARHDSRSRARRPRTSSTP